MIFKFKKHNTDLYNTLLQLSRNLFFYNKLHLKDTFETRLLLMFFHYSIILIVFKEKEKKFPQKIYDSFFQCIENNLRELGFGDVSVNKKMKEMNKIFYDILLKIKDSSVNFNLSKSLVTKYFEELGDLKSHNYDLFTDYFVKYYKFCFEISSEMIISDSKQFNYT